MNLKELIEKSNLKIDKNDIKFNEPMTKHTSFKIGGEAECFIKIKTEEELRKIIEFTNKNKIQLTIVGNGSNLLVLDGGIEGITIAIKIEGIEIEKLDNEKIKITVGAGEKLGKIGRLLLQKSITGFEELSGIPGTIGGAIYMNAGAHGKEMKDIVKTITLINKEGNIEVKKAEEMDFSYRHSCLKEEKKIVTKVVLELSLGKEEEIKAKMDEYANFRKEKQPIELPSAGSTFKRGSDFITAKLIDDAGLKGYKVGDAEVSTKHCGFVVNKGEATASDVLKLVEHIKNVIKEKFDKKIELEVEIVGKEK